MAIPNGFQKARLEIDGGDSIECAFNPQSYTISKANVWTYKPTQGRDLPDPEFGGGLPMTYKLALLLDTTLDGPDASVKDDANKLMQAMHGDGSAPKFITFTWGSVKLPKAAPMSISIQYAMFHPNGEPMRAHVVQGGDSLHSIAYESYRDPTNWRPIAEANHIDDPLRIRRGTSLTIPRLETA